MTSGSGKFLSDHWVAGYFVWEMLRRIIIFMQPDMSRILVAASVVAGADFVALKEEDLMAGDDNRQTLSSLSRCNPHLL